MSRGSSVIRTDVNKWRETISAGALLLLFVPGALFADDQAVWKEYGLLHSQTASSGNLSYTAYQMKDLTGALAAWEWQRSPDAKRCDLMPFCTTDGDRTVVLDENYLVVFDGTPKKSDTDPVLQSLPNKTDTALPAILTFIPKNGLVPNSARYVLGKASLNAFAPELSGTNPGFAEGAEAEIAQYRLENDASPTKLALFYYPSPEMARLQTIQFKLVAGARVKRSGVLVAIVYGHATESQADTLLSRVQYEAKITWNDTPPPSPIKPLYQLLLNILYLSGILSVICLAAGLIYAGMRIYRRRYGSLEAEEAMTTLHLTGD